MTLANATVTGPQGLSNVSGIRIDAGLDLRGGSTYDNIANARITGVVSSYSGITVNAGGSAEFAAGSQALAGDSIVVRTGDDIIIGTGALLQSARDTGLVFNPAAPFGPTGAIDLHAGGLTPLLSIPSTPIASLVVDGSVNAGRGAVIARANAIDGIDGAFAGSSLSFDIDNAPADGAILSDDNGLLAAPCLEGNVCLGGIAASNLLHVGQASGNDVLALTIEQGTVNAREIRIATRNDIVMGTNGIATTLNASDLFTASSRSGDVDLRDATIASNLILIEAAGSLLGSASLTSAGDIGITVGDSLFASVIDAGGELTTAADTGGALEGSYSVPGTLAVGSLSVGTGPIDYSAATIDIGALSAPGTDVRLVAAGSLSLGQTSGAASLYLEGGAVSAGNLSASGDISILSGSDVDLAGAVGGGSVSIQLPGNLSFGLLDAGGDILASAGGAINGGDLVAPGSITLDGALIAIGSATGGTLSLASQTDVLFDLLSSPNSISVSATDGTIAGNTGAGLIETDGDLTLRARAIDLRDLTAGGTIDVAVTGTALTLGTLDAGQDIVLGSAGSISVDHAEAVRHFTATAGTSFATGPNSIITGGDILIDADGPVTLGNSSAGGLVNVTGSQIDFDTLVSGQTVTMLARPSRQPGFGNGNITGNALTAGPGASAVTSTIGSVAIGGQTSVAGSLAVTANGGASFGTVAVQGGALAVTAGNGIALQGATASGNVTLTAGQSIVATGDIVSGGTLALLAQAGTLSARDLRAVGVNATATGAITLRNVILTGGGASLVSGGNILLRDVTGAGSAGVSITADGSVAFEDIASDGGVSLLAENGALTGATITSGGAVSLDGETVMLGAVSANGDVFGIAESGSLAAGTIASATGEVFLESGTLVDVASLAAATDITVQGGDVAVGSASAGRDITLASGAANGVVAGPLSAGGAIAVDAGTSGFAGASLDAGGNVGVTSGADASFAAIVAGDSVSLASTGNGNLTGTSITAGQDIAATTGGRLDVESVSASQSGTGQVNLSAAQGISISTLVGNSAQLAASGGQVRVSVDIDMTGLVGANGQSVFLRSTRNLTASASATAGDIDIETERDLDVRGAVADAGNVRLVSSGGVASVSGVSASEASPGTGGNVFIEAEENLGVAGAVSAANLLEMRAGERADINAAAVGRDIVLRASDVDIASSGSLGTLAATRSIEISGGGIARIGGDSGGTPGFIIDNSEFARIRSGGSIAIAAGTAIDIVGEVVMAGATADNAIGLSTGGDVFLDASVGLLEINNGSGTYLGTIEVEASNFLAMTEQARTDVAAATSIEAIDDRLAQNDGIDNPDGLIRAGTLDITTTTSNVFIQNTAPGTRFAERRGFTVDELLIADPAGTNQPIVINGIIDGATGVDAVALAQISSRFDPGSTINGCLIANPAGCSEIPEGLGEGSFPIQDLIDEQLEDEEAGEPGLGSGLLETPLFELKDPLDTSEDPLLDDPVTGAGNEDLWVGEQPGQ
ncbi:MAG: hypothetical protein KJZ64_07585 [Sphingomonadaceae bacterium]|nr:hypothetical protein [Sphingomonadaceae bacterium]